MTDTSPKGPTPQTNDPASLEDDQRDPVDYRETVFLPKTGFPMKANLANREGEWLSLWKSLDLYKRLREDAKGRPKYTLHDGPPYANGDIHIGHAMNKILKDVIVRTQQMTGHDAAYVPGWDCHGLPIEWKIEEKYRKSGKSKDDVDPVEFRAECRAFADHWVGVQREQFRRLGIEGDWDNPYTTMAFDAEATIVAELLKFLMDGSLYEGSKPVMWSPVEKTALAEAEVEYKDHISTMIDVAFPIAETGEDRLEAAQVVIWTTTPWTIPANRAISYGPEIEYVLVEVEAVDDGSLAAPGLRLLLARALLAPTFERMGVSAYREVSDVTAEMLATVVCAHPWRGHPDAEGGYDFDVPLLAGDHVTTDAGTGFVHTAPGHGQEDFEVCRGTGIETPQTVGPDGRYFNHVALVSGMHVYKVDDQVCELLTGRSALLSQAKFTHSYPHSWRSKAPLIFRNTAQWFVSMEATGLREKALAAIDEVSWYPAQSKNRIRTMVADRPDWVLSRQRAWGVPITVFVHKETRELVRDPEVNARIVAAVREGGADAWFTASNASLLGDGYVADGYEKVIDILDVWFDSGATQAFVVEAREELQWPADLYLEGSDQHRGWFQSSLLAGVATRGSAPYKAVLTHGFTQDGKGYKMSKSLGNVVAPEKVIKQYGADILRLWVVSTDFTDDVRIGDEILRGQVDGYRKVRNAFRFLLGNLSNFGDEERIDVADMPDLDRYILARLAELDELVRAAAAEFDYNKIATALLSFMAGDLSAFYFDIRKDSLYCDAIDDPRRRSVRTVLDALFSCLTAWYAPILAFTSEEVWQTRMKDVPGTAPSVHLRQFPAIPSEWKNQALVERFSRVRRLRRVVTGALEEDRRAKRIGSSLQAAVTLYVENKADIEVLEGLDLAEITIASSARLTLDKAPSGAFALDDVPGVVAQTSLAPGKKCERCWRVLPEVAASVSGDLCNRCAGAISA
ncbi:MAG: isoleucine--tRNA ligase [Pseudomonadota bacterium]